MGGSLSGKCDWFAQHADSSPQPHFLRYEENLIVGGRRSRGVAIDKISKRLGKRIVRKLWVVF